MKKRILLVLLLLLAGLKGYELLKEHSENSSKSAAQDQVQPKASTLENMNSDPGQANENADEAEPQEQQITLEPEQLFQGDLILINKDHKLQSEGVQQDIVKLSEHKELREDYGLLDNDIMLSTRIAEQFSVMVEAAKSSGINHFLISSGYRDFEKQDELYNQMGSNSALPAGYSEHNSGLSLDVGSTQEIMDKAPEGKWLKSNAWKYGFILRYPADKTAITGIKYEPWHFRYVGLPHSAIMHNQDLTLEEYLNYVKSQKKLDVTVEGRKYEVLFVPSSDEESTIQVPLNSSYTVSGNNMDGYIVTLDMGNA